MIETVLAWIGLWFVTTMVFVLLSSVVLICSALYCNKKKYEYWNVSLNKDDNEAKEHYLAYKANLWHYRQEKVISLFPFAKSSVERIKGRAERQKKLYLEMTEGVDE